MPRNTAKISFLVLVITIAACSRKKTDTVSSTPALQKQSLPDLFANFTEAYCSITMTQDVDEALTGESWMASKKFLSLIALVQKNDQLIEVALPVGSFTSTCFFENKTANLVFVLNTDFFSKADLTGDSICSFKIGESFEYAAFVLTGDAYEVTLTESYQEKCGAEQVYVSADLGMLPTLAFYKR